MRWCTADIRSRLNFCRCFRGAWGHPWPEQTDRPRGENRRNQCWCPCFYSSGAGGHPVGEEEVSGDSQPPSVQQLWREMSRNGDSCWVFRPVTNTDAHLLWNPSCRFVSVKFSAVVAPFSIHPPLILISPQNQFNNHPGHLTSVLPTVYVKSQILVINLIIETEKHSSEWAIFSVILSVLGNF